MKILITTILFISSLLSQDYVELYRIGGLKAVEKSINIELQSREYWFSKIRDKDVRYGYYENIEHILLCNKDKKSLELYEIKDRLNRKFNFNAYVGLKGDKQFEGDLKTPIGVYDLIDRRDVTTYQNGFYGPLAFVTSYPNSIDRVNKKSGYGIWIHGVPFNSKRAVNTKGCIALKNANIEKLDENFDYKKSLLIIAENAIATSSKYEISSILSSIFQWKEAWKNSDIERYLSFYSEDFSRYDNMKFQEFKKFKRRLFKRTEKKRIEFKNIDITPYFNIKNEKIFRITFDELYRTRNYSFDGKKELYVKLKNNKIVIVVEK